MGIYKCLREKLKQMLEYENQSLSWETMETFTNELSKFAQEGFKLYRYSPADYYNIRNFETGRLRLTCNGELNDIYEGLPVFDIEGEDKEKLQELKDCAYIKCFSEDYRSNLMWAHYADNHKGICVEYDLSLLDWKNDIWRHIFPVLYENDRPFSAEAVLKICDSQNWLNFDIFQNAYPSEASILNDALIMYLFKGTEWEREKEWRIIYSKYQLYCNSGNGVIDNMIAFDCATAIYLGQRIDPEVRSNIAEIVNRINNQRNTSHKPRIKIYDITPDDRTYSLKGV